MEYLTTGEIASMLGISTRTVMRYLNEGIIKGHKLPGRGNNRVHKTDFIQFCEAYDLPVPDDIATTTAKPTVLVIDDDINVCTSICRVLKRYDFNTYYANDGVKAGALLNQHKPQVMTLDIGMPKLNGLDVLRFTREHPDFADIKIIMISGTANDNLQSALLDGADAIIQKPFKNEVLIGTIVELISD